MAKKAAPKKRIIKGRDYNTDKRSDGLRQAKSGGWRMAGTNRKPTKKEIQAHYDGASNGVYMENRIQRIDRNSRAKKGERFEKGGFVGKGELVWKKLDNAKKAEFLKENFTPEITPRTQEILVGKAYNFLPSKVKIVLNAKYANVEEYAKGGEINPTLNEKVFKRAEEIYALEKGKTKEDFDKAFDKSIIEFGHDPIKYHKIMNEIGAEHDDDSFDEYKKGGKIDRTKSTKKTRVNRTKKAIAQDKNIKALHGGKRISENGNVYYENRENRQDTNRTKKLAKGGDLSDYELEIGDMEYAMISNKSLSALKKEYKDEIKNEGYSVYELPKEHPDRRRGNKYGLFKPKESEDNNEEDFSDSDDDSKLEYIADLIRKENTSGYSPNWRIKYDIHKDGFEMREPDYEHVASQVEKGVTAGELNLVNDDDSESSGWWSIEINDEYAKGGSVEHKNWLKGINDKRLSELKLEKIKVEELPNDYVEVGGSRRNKAQILSDFDDAILERESKEYSQGGEIKGRGWGEFKKGKRISDSAKNLKVGKLYLKYSPQFNSENIVLITKEDTTGLNRDIVYGSFVRPKDLEGKEENFAIWGHDLNSDEYYEIDGMEYEKGGHIGFDKLAKKVAKEYEGDKVKPEYQAEYGKTYDKAEALEVGQKVAAKVYRGQEGMMEKGGDLGSYVSEDKKFNDYKKTLEEKYGKGFSNKSLSEEEFEKLYELKERRSNSYEKNITIEDARNPKMEKGGEIKSELTLSEIESKLGKTFGFWSVPYQVSVDGVEYRKKFGSNTYRKI